MSNPTSQPAITSESIHWQHQYQGNTRQITTEVYDNSTLLPDNPEPPLLIIPGYGEKRYSATKTLEFCAELGVRAVAAIADPRQAGSSVPELEAFATDFPIAVIGELQEQERVSDTVQVAGHSMGGGILGLGLREAPELFDSVAFMQPIGLDTEARRQIIPDNEARRRAFTRRFTRIVLGLYGETSLRGRFHAAHDVLSEIALDAHEHRFKSKAILSTTQSAVPAAVSHAINGNRVVVFTGSKDPIVRPKEVYQSFMTHIYDNPHISVAEAEKAGKNLKFPELPIKHAYLGWKTSQYMLRQVIDLLKNPNARITNTVQNTNTES